VTRNCPEQGTFQEAYEQRWIVLAKDIHKGKEANSEARASPSLRKQESQQSISGRNNEDGSILQCVSTRTKTRP